MTKKRKAPSSAPGEPGQGLSSDARAAVRQLLASLTQGPTSGISEIEPGEPFAYFSRQGVGVALSGDELTLYNKCLHLIAPAQDNPGRLSRHAVTQLLNELIIDILTTTKTSATDEQRTRAAISAFDSRCRKMPENFEVGLQVGGIRLAADVRVCGVLFTTTERLVKRRWVRNIAEGELANEKGLVWAVVTVSAVDREAAHAIAAYEIQLALDAINFYAGRLKAPEGAAAYLPGVRDLRNTFRVSRPRTSPHGALGRRTAGPLWINLRPVHRFHGYRRLRGILRPAQDRTDAQERMFSTIRWIGRGAVTPWNEQALLNFVVALESLVLGPSRESELKFRLRLRSSLLMAAKRKFRKNVFDRVGELYDVRSAIVHRGSLHVTPDLRDSARTIAVLALLETLRHPSFFKLRTNGEVEDWFERRMLGLAGRHSR